MASARISATPNISTVLLFAWLSLVVLAQTPDNFPHKLGIDLNALTDDNIERSKPPKHLLYTSVVTYDDDANEKEMQMRHREVRARSGNPALSQPRVMAALAIGKEVYFGSSLTGSECKNFVYLHHKNSPVTKKLDESQKAMLGQRKGGKHRTGFCGELMASTQFFDRHSDVKKLPGGRLVAWGGVQRDGDQETDGYLVAPCGKNSQKPDKWGCHHWAEDLGVDIVLHKAWFPKHWRSKPPVSQIKRAQIEESGVSLKEKLLRNLEPELDRSEDPDMNASPDTEMALDEVIQEHEDKLKTDALLADATEELERGNGKGKEI
ncbi:MAG: hypothetical protein M1823_003132 [Watsoniomyces obsoletus]|nr:MAG: hypothetical protein M1823_003132 [Watsoniomyces obsoletus]